MQPLTSPLNTDLYQLNMMQAYLDRGDTQTAVFELFVRTLPPQRGFLLAAGLEQALDYLENLRFTSAEIAWLENTGKFRKNLLDYLRSFRFSGDVHAMDEGIAFFANEPILRITAPLPQAQLVESRLINIIHYQLLVAAKAARCVLAAPGKLLVDFGMRRAHGAEAALMAARASYIAGFAGTATVLAGENFGIPLYGTMAHSFIEAFDDEAAAFESFARARPDNVVLLLDTYDTEAAARKVVTLAPKLKAAGIAIRGVRLDSGDLIALSKSVRAILDNGGLKDVTIFASGGLDEHSLLTFAREGAPIDGLGIGTSMTTSADVPYIDCVYKMQDYAGQPRRKRSDKKATWPGRKQVWRRFEADGRMSSDLLALETRVPYAGGREAMLHQVMKEGHRIGKSPSLDEVRKRAAKELERLPEPLRRLEADAIYPVEVSENLVRLAAEVDRRIDARNAPAAAPKA
ncbi:MAG TPA: nicotinate phosphoribosyltransferase [Xanthobacteraceae bacterium]|jgi:nicotinate phosphoribosyltransferase|nr:nicotinate phosphoribosyltransferase [Xanthobacteraceae bacterium]